MSWTRDRRLRLAAGFTVVAAGLAACGTQLSHAQIVADYNGGGGAAVSTGTSGAADATGTTGTGGTSPVSGSDATPGAVATAAAGGSVGGGPVGGTPATAGAAGGTAPTQGAAPAGGNGAAAVPTSGASARTPAATATGKASAVSTSAASSSGAACTKQGTTLEIGQVGSFSGVVGPVFAGSKTAMAIWASSVNAAGGIACHPVHVDSEDDQANPSQAGSDAQDLIQNKHAIALVASAVPESIQGLQPVVDNAKVAAVGGDGANDVWTSDPYFRVQGGAYTPSLIGMAKAAVQAGKPKIGLLSCIEAEVCSSSGPALQSGAPGVGATLVYKASVSITQPSFTSQCQAAQSAGAQALIIGLDSSGIQRVARDCKALGYTPQLITTATAMNEPAVQTDPNLQGMIVTSRVAPWMNGDTPGLAAFQAAVQRYAPQFQVDESAIEGWTSAELFEAAIRALGPAAQGNITPAMVLQGLGMVKNETLGGLSPAMSFVDGQPSPSLGCYYLEELGGNRWSAPGGSKMICN